MRLVRASFVAAGVGAVVLVAEFAAVRVSAPWFGQSSYVWSAAVGVVLFALALGYALGGRLAEGDPSGRLLPRLLGLAGLWLALASAFAAPLARLLIPPEVGADRPLPLALWGSLAQATALLGPALVLAGAASPLLLRGVTTVRTVAPAAGALSAAGTLGSLVGCALAPLVLIPALGARGALALCGAVLGLLGLLAPGADSDRGSAAEAESDSEDGSFALPLRLTLAAGLVGLAVTVVEFGAARALAPAYGASNPVWAGILAVVLGALAFGGSLGGRLHAARDDGMTSRVLLFGAAALTIAAFFALRLRLGDALPAAAVLFTVPLVACGAAMPALVGGLATRGRRGAAAGRLWAANTVGGVVGVFVTPLYALPEFGTEDTLLGASLALAFASLLSRSLPGALSLDPRPSLIYPRPEASGAEAIARSATRGTVGRFVSLAALGAGVGLLLLPRDPLRSDPGQVLELETGYQTVRLIEREDVGPLPGPNPLEGPYGAVPVRFLRFDEDTTSYQSMRLLEDEARLLTAGRYYDHLALGAWFEGMPWSRTGGGDPRVLIIGYCGGTVHRVLRLVSPEGRAGADVRGVELDPDVARLGRERLGAVEGPLDLRTGVDGRTVVNELAAGDRFDLILVDAYARTQYVPFQLATLEFFAACRAHLTPRGVLGVNVNAPGGLRGHVLGAIAQTLSAAFPGGGVWLVPNVQYPGNAAIWATQGRLPPRVAAGAPASLSTAAFTLDRLLVRWVPSPPPAPRPRVLTDDRAPVEQLADRDLLEELKR